MSAIFPTDWKRRCSITIDKTKVAADQTDFPVLVGYNAVGTENNLPDEILDSGSAHCAQDDGGDVYFTSDSAGSNRLSCELVVWTKNATKASRHAEIWVKIPALSSTANTTIYVWYNSGVTATQPAANVAYGSQSVWDSNYTAVWHLKTSGGSVVLTDSTSNGFTLTNDSVTAGTGRVSGGGVFAGTSESLSSASYSTYFLSVSTGSLEIWANPNATQQNGTYRWWDPMIFGSRSTGGANYGIMIDPSNIEFYVGDSGGDKVVSTAWTANAWAHLAWVHTGGTLYGYVNGASVGSTGAGNISGGITTFNWPTIGASNAGSYYSQPYKGYADEARMSKSARSATWVTTCYNNQGAPQTFWSVGTPVSLISVVKRTSMFLTL